MRFSAGADVKPKPDSHVTIVPYFTVPEGKMDEFKAGFPAFYEHTRRGTGASGECLYYGFAQEGNTVFCREGYKSAEGVLAHLDEVKAELGKAVALVGDGGLELAVMGPAAELVSLHTVALHTQAARMYVQPNQADASTHASMCAHTRTLQTCKLTDT